MFIHSPTQPCTTGKNSAVCFSKEYNEYDDLQKEIDDLIETNGESRNSLIPILQEIKKRRTFVNSFAMQYVADRLNLSSAEVYGVVSFYSFLKEQNYSHFTISLCQTISCDMADKARIAKELESVLDIKFGETTSDGMFTLQWTNCIGMCDESPAMLINEQVFSKITPEKINEIIKGCRETYQENKKKDS